MSELTTNELISTDSKLFTKGQNLLKAAAEYFDEYQKSRVPAGVVWLKNEKGNCVVITRGDYLPQIMESIEPYNMGSVASFEDNPFYESEAQDE